MLQTRHDDALNGRLAQRVLREATAAETAVLPAVVDEAQRWLALSRCEHLLPGVGVALEI